ncbi:DUF6049 family protein [Cellulosimicrobium arenosum]|uniref:Uncharacterized protein n=1 Tax=Cellulosimicrobium arenosum TaxID=2708133 RepID=A0A927J146_9MICO|nr:DUF6049 family protein [Cellulosimicrobium arenosum]MBD8079971.1 hypothetical protein [Cellulosimicrobium arenosum]
MTSTASRGVRATRASTPVRSATSAWPVVLRFLTAVLLGGLALLPTGGPALADPAASGALGSATDEPGVTVQLLTLSPGVLTPDDTLDLTVRVTNAGTAAVAAPAAFLGVDRRSLDTRSSLDGWVEAGVVGRTGYRVADESLDPIAPGDSVDVPLSVPADRLGIVAGSDWGPRGIVVVVTDAGSRVAATRTFVVGAPPGDVEPLRLSVLAAVTGPAVDPDAQTYDDALAAATAESGRLGRLLAATGTTTQVGWAVDPALVAAAAASADPAVEDWAASLDAATADRTTFALEAYDPDLAAYARAGADLPRGTPLPGSDPEPAASDAQGTPPEWRTDLAWPADPVPDVETTTLAASSGATAVVVGGGGLAPDDALTYTPTGLARVSTTAGEVTALVADPTVTSLVAAGDDLATSQRLLAETAVVARERPAETRYVLAALDRTWEPDPAALSAKLDVLGDAPWVEVAPVSEMLSAPVPAVDRAALPDVATAETEMPAAELGELGESRAELAEFASVAVEPAALTRPLEPRFVTPTSVAYRADPENRTRAVQDVQRAVATTTGKISLQLGSTITFIAESENLPVQVYNQLPEDVVVQVVLRPDGQQLQVTQRPTASVPAGEEVTVPVPVEAFGSGNVTVAVELVSAADPQVRVADPQDLVVRVRADWESVGTVVVAGLLAVGLLAGIWRTVRRGRSPRRTAGTEEES